MSTPALRFHGVTKSYGGAPAFTALGNFTLDIEPGECFGLVGANGAGKTTLIRSILSLTPPRSGLILHDGSDITGLPTHQIVRRGIACIPEGRRVFPRMTVRDNLRMGAYREADSSTLDPRMAGVFEIFPGSWSASASLGVPCPEASRPCFPSAAD